MNSVYGNEKAIVNAEYRRSRECFLQNAFLFLENAERILSDTRMSNARVSVSNELAYMGAFPTANLGTYIDWWKNSGLDEILHDDNERKALTWSVSGSPLTGMNSCMCVYPDGTTTKVSHGSFGRKWKTFIEALKRHRSDEDIVDSFTIEEVAEILKRDAVTEEQILRVRLTVQQGASLRLRHYLNRLFANYQDIMFRYDSITLKYHEEELSSFRKEYIRKTSETAKELQAISEIVCASRKAFREGGKSKDAHNHLMREMNQRRTVLKEQLRKFKADKIAQLTANGELSKEQVGYYLHSNNLKRKEHSLSTWCKYWSNPNQVLQ